FGFYGRTGGAAESHWVDDLNIALPDNGYVTLAGTNVQYLPPRNGCGTDTFYYQVSDGQGGLAWDSANVQLIDITPPIIFAAPTNRTIFANANCFAALPDFTVASGIIATDSCTLTITQAPLAGTLVGLGVTAVTVFAVDASGNSTNVTAFATNRDITLPAISCTATSMAALPGLCYVL